MPDILTKQVDLGFDANIRDASELPRGSVADGSQNVRFNMTFYANRNNIKVMLASITTMMMVMYCNLLQGVRQ